MTKVTSVFNNFARGRIDHDMMGRFDLPIYPTGCDWFDNFISNFKGNAIFRAGFENMLELEDCELVEFKFSDRQAYIAIFTANKIRFASYDVNGNFGWVLNGMVPFEVETPYSLAEAKELDFSQNKDVMVLTHNSHAPRKLTRTSPTTFTLTAFVRTADPFVTLDAAKVITGITQANPAVVTVTTHGYATGDQVIIYGVVGMTQVNGQIFTITVLTANTFQLNGINSTGYTAYASGGSVQKFKSTAITAVTQANPAVVTSTAHGLSTGQRVTIYGIVGMTQLNGNTYTVTVIDANNFSLNVNSTGFTAYASGGFVRHLGDYPACCLFYKGRLYYANTPLKITTLFASQSGAYDNFTTTPVDAKAALIFEIADIALPILWLYPGDNSLIVGAADGVVAVNGGSVGAAITASTVEANITSAPPANNSYPLAKDGLIFYVDRTSRTLQYFSYDLLSERFAAEDANFISYDITRGLLGKIRFKKDRNDLIFALCGEDMLSLNFNQKERIIGWHRHTTMGSFNSQVVIPDNNGDPQLFVLARRNNGDYFLERQDKYVEFPNRVEFFTGDSKEDKARDDMAYIRKVAEMLKQCNYLDNSAKVSNLKNNLITYNPGTGIITSANPVFQLGDVGKHIVYKTDTGYESGRFEITAWNNASSVDVDVLQEPTSNTYQNWYLTFNGISGLANYTGQTIGVVTDGGYLADFEVDGSGTIDLGKQVSFAVVGYKYRGLIKSFSLGFPAGAVNTQTTMKAVNGAELRFVQTAGGKFGTSPYRLTNVQELKQGDLNYLPPVPMDGTVSVTYPDGFERDKYYYLVQEDPLPMTAVAVMLTAAYTMSPP